MSSLERALARGVKESVLFKPGIFDLARGKDQTALHALFRARKIHHVIDDYREEQLELFQVQHPSRVYTSDFQSEFEAYWKQLLRQKPPWQHGRWVYYPWLSSVVHVLPDTEFQMVRTARNKNLITADEQKKFYDAVIGIGGLSIGNSVALAIALQGGGRRIRLADHDHLALSNTNRVRTGVQNLGLPKVEMTARQIYELNPYAIVELFPEGLTAKNIGKFFSGPPALDIVVDEVDNFAVKYLLRQEAKKHRIAVVMAADNGDNAVVDVERYDKNRNLKFFHGRIRKVTYEQLLNLDKFEIGKTITRHIGAENVTERMQKSLLQMRKTIVSWPQLGGAALINGSAVAYCVRKILNNQPLEGNRAIISLDEKLVPSYDSRIEKRKRMKTSLAFKKIFGL